MPPASDLRVMSFNLRYGTADDGPDRWEVRRERVFTLLRRHRPEVLGTQEALSFQIDELREAQPGFGVVGVGRDDGRGAGEHAAILFDPSRLLPLRTDTFWFSDTPGVPGSRHWGNRLTRICTWAFFRDLRTARHLYFYNVHLDHEHQPSRERSADLLLRHISERATGDPVLITGDLNVGEENPVPLAITAGGFRDTFRTLHPNATALTFNGFRDNPGERLDYIFANAGWTVREAAILEDRFDGRWPSDHLPVTATVAAEGWAD